MMFHRVFYVAAAAFPGVGERNPNASGAGRA
jgi:hypothetical protein